MSQLRTTPRNSASSGSRESVPASTQTFKQRSAAWWAGRKTHLRHADEESQDAKPLPRVRMDELCQDTVRSYRTLYDNSHKGHPWVKLSDDEFLRAIGAAAYRWLKEDGL